MALFLLSGGYVAAHLLAYAVMLDRRRVHERGVLAYHVGSFILLLAVLAPIFWFGAVEDALAAVVAAACLHAIYSLTFLELWALADGSFSLPILADFARPMPPTLDEVLARHASSGDAKKAFRIGTLVSLGLVRREGGLYRLTRCGRIVAGLFSLLTASAGITEHG